MRRPFHTFLSNAGNFNNNVFYSGALNAMIKNMLLQNVKDLFKEKDELLSVSKKVYSVSAECLDTLSDISKREKKNGNNPVLFNLLKDIDCCHLNLGLAITKQESPELKKILEDLKAQTAKETKKKFFEKILNDKKTDIHSEEVLSLMMVAMK
ncbi:MAG: hypothetical protein IAF38_14025, partial [Bacteroidia bacterium]|nr:hypothetical protein [Bacteroidia bacterium]